MDSAGTAFFQEVTRLMRDAELERADKCLVRFRPVLVEDVGEEIADRVLGDPGILDFVLRAVGNGAADEVDAAYAVATYLREAPDASIEQAYAVGMARVRRYAELRESA